MKSKKKNQSKGQQRETISKTTVFFQICTVYRCINLYLSVWLLCFTCPFTLYVHLNKRISISKRNESAAAGIWDICLFTTAMGKQPCDLDQTWYFDLLLFCSTAGKLGNWDVHRHMWWVSGIIHVMRVRTIFSLFHKASSFWVLVGGGKLTAWFPHITREEDYTSNPPNSICSNKGGDGSVYKKVSKRVCVCCWMCTTN